VDFKVSRARRRSAPKEFAEGLGSGSTVISPRLCSMSTNREDHLERELGLQQANRLMSGEFEHLVLEVRFFRPQQEEEFQCGSACGEIVTYEHKIEEARAAKSLNREQAQSAAQGFFAGQARHGPEQLNFLRRRPIPKTRRTA